MTENGLQEMAIGFVNNDEITIEYHYEYDNSKAVVASAMAMCFMAAESMFFDDEDEIENWRWRKKRKAEMSGHSERIVPSLPDLTFKQGFRMSKSIFENLLKLLAPQLTGRCKNALKRLPVSPEKQLLITLWFLGSCESSSSIGNRFAVCKDLVKSCSIRTAFAIIQLNLEEGIVAWPRGQSALSIQKTFQIRYKIPGVIGCIGNTYVTIPPPKCTPELFLNRHHVHSLSLQTVCDHSMRFTNCYAGEIGSLKETSIFERSPLGKLLKQDETMLPAKDSYVIGDSTFPLLPYLMVPYAKAPDLTTKQEQFNLCLAAVRRNVQNALLVLKRRFRRLEYLQLPRLGLFPDVIIASCILHNFCIEDVHDYEPFITSGDCEESEIDRESPASGDCDTEALSKRDQLANLLSEM